MSVNKKRAGHFAGKSRTQRHHESAPAPCSVEIPSVDGYYWMRNLSYDGEEVWRIVRVAYSPSAKGRVASDGRGPSDILPIYNWEGVQFHGPLLPPNAGGER